MPIDLKNNFTLTSSNDVMDICNNFMRKMNLSYFLYARLYDDYYRFNLTTCPQWVEHYFLKDYYNIAKLDKHPSCYHTCYVLWDHWNNDSLSYQLVEKDAEENYGIYHGLSILIRGNNYFESFDFATTYENYSINNLYLSHIDIFENFSLYFLEKAKTLITQAKKDKFLINYADSVNIYSEYPDTLLNARELNVLEKISQPFLTCRELDCVSWLLKGKTLGELAEILEISQRTAEKHLINIKNKLNCKTLFQLGQRISQLGLDKFLSLL